MQIITLYRYERIGGGITVSTVMPDTEGYTTKYRLIADDGMVLTDGAVEVDCVDVDSTDEWIEKENEHVE